MNEFADAIDFILHARESRAGGTTVGGAENLPLLWEHLKLTLVAMGLGMAVALPLGLFLGHTRKGAFLAISASNVGRAVPSVALIALFVAFFPRTSEFTNVAVALALLAIPPILTNTYVGVAGVSPDAVDAARGTGMSDRQVIRRVELPLAMPLIFGGIRTSTVNVLATATVAPLVGVVTLGDPIIAGSVYGREGQIGASILVALLAIVAELGLAAAQRTATPTGVKLERSPSPTMTTPRRLLFTALALFAACLFAVGCGDDEADDTGGAGTDTTATEPAPAAGTIAKNPDNAKTTITMGSKNFTEQKLLGEIFAQGLAAAGYTVKTDLNLGDSDTALKAIKGGEIDAYPEYTGTALLTFFDVKANEIPKDPAQAFEDAKAGFEKEGLVAFPPTPFTSSNEVGLTKEMADKLGVTKISDLAEHDQDLTLYGSPECRKRTDCLLGLEQVYGLKFKKFVPVDIAQRHEVLTSGRADVSIVFTTDPQNAREGFVLLEDDQKMFPPYNSTLVVRKEIADAAGADLAPTIEAIQTGLTSEAMQELNARADLDKQGIKDVAAAYLKESGLTE